MQHYVYVTYIVGDFYFNYVHYNLFISVYIFLWDNSIEIKLSYSRSFSAPIKHF